MKFFPKTPAAWYRKNSKGSVYYIPRKIVLQATENFLAFPRENMSERFHKEEDEQVFINKNF